MNAAFFVTCLRLHFHRMKKPMLLIFMVAVLVLLLCYGVAAAGSLLLAGEGFTPITLVISDDSDDAMLEQIVSYIGEMSDIRSYARLIRASSLEARRLVSGGEASAALVFPDGFLQSVDSGEDLSPLLILDASKPIEALGISLLAESAAAMLTNAQKGIYFTAEAYFTADALFGQNPDVPDFDSMIWDINLKYVSWVLDRSEIYQTRLVSPTGSALSISRHYVLGALLFFAFITPVGLLYPVYSWAGDRAWLSRISRAGSSLFTYALAQILWGGVAVLILLIILIAGLSGAGLALARLEPGVHTIPVFAADLLADLMPVLTGSTLLKALPGLVLCSVFISTFTFICCNAGNIISALSLHFISACIFLYMSGGMVPAAFMPQRARALGSLSPFTWLRDMLAPLYPVVSRGATAWDTSALSVKGIGPAPPGLKLACAISICLAFIWFFCRGYSRRNRRGIT